MADGQPREVMPHTESHQSLSGKLGVSRPLPPRSRSRGTGAAAKSAYEAPETPNSESVESSHNVTSSDPLVQANLEGKGTASPTHATFQRSVSGNSIRSQRSTSAQYGASDIPKEEIEKALQGLDRDDLVVALGRAKVQMDEIEARLDDQLLENETLRASTSALTQQLGRAETESQSLQLAMKQREDRIDEMMADQDRMESEIYSTMQVIERLRKQLSETEKNRNDAEKRYLDQTATMDKERQYYADTEALLKSHKTTQATAYEKLLSSHSELLKEHERVTNRLASIKSSTSHPSGLNDVSDYHNNEAKSGKADSERPENGTDESHDGYVFEGVQPRLSSSVSVQSRLLSEERDLVELRDELANTQKSHASLSETIATLQTELKDVRAENVSLRDQNETFMNILQEKTFSGALLNESAMLRGLRASSDGYQDETRDDSNDSEDESTEDDGQESKHHHASTILDDEEEGEGDDVPDTPKALGVVSKVARRQRKKSRSFLAPPSDLASELEQINEANEPLENVSRREKNQSDRLGPVSDPMDELHTEVRELREANQALTLYISKIIDRIIAKEGYENILAIESRGGTVRGTRRKASQTRPSLQSAFDAPSSSDLALRTQTAADSSSMSATSNISSGGFFGFGGSSQSSAATDTPQARKPKSKRGASIDWRNIPFLGGGSSNAAADSSANLKPLTLQSSSLLIPPRDGSARKLRTSEEIEDEQDAVERDLIRQELTSRGIAPPDNQLSSTAPRKTRPQSIAVTSSGAGGFAAFFSRVVGHGPGSLLSPARSDTMSQPSSTPGQTTDPDIGSVYASTPSEQEKRRLERNRALHVSTGGTSTLTNPSGGQAIASRARQLRAERHQLTLDNAAGNSSSSSSDKQTGSGLTSSSASTCEGSTTENSVAGDESYCLPMHVHQSAGVKPLNDFMGSPLLGYGNSLPPLPHETTGDEDPDAYRSPTLSQTSQPLSSSQDLGWKKAFRRVSYLGSAMESASPSVASPTGTHHGSDYISSPISTSDALPLSSPAAPGTASKETV